MKRNYYRLSKPVYTGRGYATKQVIYGEGLGDMFKSMSRGISRFLGSPSVQKFASNVLGLIKEAGTSLLEAGKEEAVATARRVGTELGEVARARGTEAFEDIVAGENVERSIRRAGRKARGDVEGIGRKAVSGKEAKLSRDRMRNMMEQRRIQLQRDVREEARELEASAPDLLDNLLSGNGLTQLGVRRRGRGMRQLGNGRKKK
jgi:hypothetical protein